MNRRTVLKGGLVLAATSHTAVGTATPVDPLLEAIHDFREGCERYNVMSRTMADGDEEAYILATCGPPQDRLCAWTAPAITREGAIEALKFMEEQDVFIDRIGEGMRRAVLGYLEGLA